MCNEAQQKGQANAPAVVNTQPSSTESCTQIVKLPIKTEKENGY